MKLLMHKNKEAAILSDKGHLKKILELSEMPVGSYGKDPKFIWKHVTLVM